MSNESTKVIEESASRLVLQFIAHSLMLILQFPVMIFIWGRLLMSGEILLDKQTETPSEEERGWFENLEEKIRLLLAKFQEIKRERDNLAAALDTERGKVLQLERKLKLLSQDREKVKTRIDQLLHRFRGIDA